jgi:hypothetical protein
VTTRNGDVTIAAGTQIRGDVSCEDLDLHDDAEVDGTIRARGEVAIRRDDARPSIADAEARDDGAGADAEPTEPAPAVSPDGTDGPSEPTDWSELTPAVTRVESTTPGTDAEAEADDAAGEDGDERGLQDVIAEAER